MAATSATPAGRTTGHEEGLDCIAPLEQSTFLATGCSMASDDCPASPLSKDVRPVRLAYQRCDFPWAGAAPQRITGAPTSQSIPVLLRRSV
jgi:hypothetical protein